MGKRRRFHAAAGGCLFLLFGGASALGQAQAQLPQVILEVDLENKVQYHEDATSEIAKFASDQGSTAITRPRNFGKFVSIADIVAVNGQPVKGLALYRTQTVTLRANPVNPGEGIADLDRNGVIDQMFEFLTSDGVPIGTIFSSGLAAGAAPAGAPLTVAQGNLGIVGGTGAFLGARGELGQGATTVADRMASMNEDPVNRRRNGGGKVRIIIHVIPQSRPQILAAASGPAIAHSNDFSLVTSSKPAAAGEILSMFVSGLGPTRPGVNPGQAFPASPLANANAPVAVTVNGKAAQVLAAVGYPGAVDTYQVNFRVPTDAAAGTATVQVSAAWISGAPVSIAVQ